jgi:hypothetical protein
MLTYDGIKRANNQERAVLTEEQSRKAVLLALYEKMDERGRKTAIAMMAAMAKMAEVR